MRRYWIGIDPAITTGVCLWYPNDQKAWVWSVKANPVQIVKFIEGQMEPEDQYVLAIERLHNFLNANTTRSILELTGFIRYHFLYNFVLAEEYSPKPARKWFGAKTKGEVLQMMQKRVVGGERITSDQADAALMAIYAAEVTDGMSLNHAAYLIYRKGELKL